MASLDQLRADDTSRAVLTYALPSPQPLDMILRKASPSSFSASIAIARHERFRLIVSGQQLTLVTPHTSHRLRPQWPLILQYAASPADAHAAFSRTTNVQIELQRIIRVALPCNGNTPAAAVRRTPSSCNDVRDASRLTRRRFPMPTPVAANGCSHHCRPPPAPLGSSAH